uniref:tetraacyldisaccharide 4'-kinase n=1 Tax=Candidatus Scatousia sp. TaxID=3085663 RepID=UPI004028A91E
MKNLKSEITKIHYNKDAKGIFIKILEFASIFYGMGSGLKNFLYDKNILKPKNVNAFVISVGNITTGGVGKTPVVAEIAKYLYSQGEKTAIISRGYGGKLSNKQINLISDGKKIYYNANLAGDEPFWLAENSKGTVVITSKNRYAAAEYAIKEFGATHIILDDGFQHRKLYRDIDIVLSDSEKGFGNEKLLPAGPLREGSEAFKRIDKLVIVSKNFDHTR